MKFLLLATMALAAPDHEYLTERPDALGAYMRCAAKAFDEDSSIDRSEAMDRIKVECRAQRDQAIEIFVPLYHRKMGLPEPITDSDTAERTILSAVMAEQMRREEEAMLTSSENYADNGAPQISVIPQSAVLDAPTVCIQPADDDAALRAMADRNGVSLRPAVDESCNLILLSNKAPKVRLPQIYSSEVQTINSPSCITDFRSASPGFGGAAATYYIEQKEGSRLACIVELVALRGQG